MVCSMMRIHYSTQRLIKALVIQWVRLVLISWSTLQIGGGQPGSDANPGARRWMAKVLASFCHASHVRAAYGGTARRPTAARYGINMSPTIAIDPLHDATSGRQGLRERLLTRGQKRRLGDFI